jgi:hypothetical protein
MPKTAHVEKVDLYKHHKSEYVTPKEPVLLKIGPAKYLTAGGEGATGGKKFQLAVGALYQAAFTTKMAKKFAGRDYRVCHLEGLWWGPELTQASDTWRWKLMLRVPEFIAAADLKSTAARLKEKGKSALPVPVRLETIREGRCVQVLRTGPYWSEPATMGRGPHHEVYLSDPRRVAPEKLRTILRLPVA